MVKVFLLLLLLSSGLLADEFRTWTQAATGRTLEAKMTDRKEDFSKAKVVTRKGKVHWLVAADLVEADRKFILDWQPEIDHLSVKVVGSSSGGAKTIGITARAGNDPITVHIYHTSGSGVIRVVEVAPRQTWTGEHRVGSKYRVLAKDHKGAVIDEEAWNKKKGL